MGSGCDACFATRRRCFKEDPEELINARQKHAVVEERWACLRRLKARHEQIPRTESNVSAEATISSATRLYEDEYGDISCYSLLSFTKHRNIKYTSQKELEQHIVEQLGLRLEAGRTIRKVVLLNKDTRPQLAADRGRCGVEGEQRHDRKELFQDEELTKQTFEQLPRQFGFRCGSEDLLSMTNDRDLEDEDDEDDKLEEQSDAEYGGTLSAFERPKRWNSLK